MSDSGNTFKARKALIEDGKTLTIVITLEALISKVGKEFVYYTSGGEYNLYPNVSLDILLGGYQGLQTAGVYETLIAGKTYTIVRDSESAETKESGFYYNGTIADITTETKGTTYQLSIVEDADGYVSGLASISGDALTINHLSNKYEEAYIVLKLTLLTDSTQFAWYYRTKVEPNYEISDISYPYAEDGEYLDESSNYFDGEKYSIDFAEQFANGNNSGKTRFGEIAFIQNAVSDLTYQYSIKSATVAGQTITNWEEFFTYSFDGDKFVATLFDNSIKLNIKVTRKVFVGDVEMIGAEQDYLFIFNQGTTYKFSLTKEGDSEPLTATGNVYSYTISAGSDEMVFVPVIERTENNVDTPVSFIGMYIKGENLGSALQSKLFLPKGTILYTDDTGATENGTLENDLVFGDWGDSATANDNDVYTITIGDTTYYTKTVPTNSYAYAENNKLHIKPQATVDKDYVAEIGFYTTERVVFKLNLCITSYFTWTINDDFVGGKTYYFLKTSENPDDIVTDTIFTSVSSKLTEKTISNITLSLKAPAEGDNLDAKYVDIVSNESDWQNSKITFAHLTEDKAFAFTATITASDESKYEFDFTIVVSKSFDNTKQLEIVDTAKRYGTISFTVGGDGDNHALKDIKETLGFAKDDTVKFVTGKGDDDENADTFAITPKNVNEITTYTQEIEVSYSFNGNEIFTTKFNYKYTVYPNVTLAANYPMADGETVSTYTLDDGTKVNAEYIGTTLKNDVYVSETIRDFFGSSAIFASDNRIVVTEVDGVKDETLGYSYTITIDEIDNVICNVINGNTVTIYSSKSTNKTIYNHQSEPSLISMQFELESSEKNGIIVFNYTCNTVSVQYRVVVVAGEVVTISTNAPNYEGNKETVYAEDLAKMNDQALFKENRILSTTFSSSVAENSTYYVRYTSGSTTKVFEITATQVATTLNIDLGESLTGYTYGGTFKDKASAQDNVADNKYDDETIYESAPTLTSRAVAKYYDGTAVKLDDSTKLQLLFSGNKTKIVYQFSTTAKLRAGYRVHYTTTYGETKSILLRCLDYNEHSVIIQDFVEITSVKSSLTFTGGVSILSVAVNSESEEDKSEYIDGLLKVVSTEELLDPYDADDFGLTAVDYDEIINLGLQLSIGGKKISATGAYNFYLNVEFGVDNPTTYDDRTVQTIYAGTELSLFDNYNTYFGIRNTRTGVKYTRELMAQSSGEFALYIYGFEENPINSTTGDVLKIHKDLINASVDGIKYYTGLTPRAGAEINEQNVSLLADSDLTKNYITISGVPVSESNSKVCDYVIRAQGCNNDGNYIMMKLVYVVDVAGTNIVKEYNIMFKVEPGDTEVRFKSRQEEASTTNPSSSQLVADKYYTVASNYESPYTITNGDVNFNLWNNNASTETGSAANAGQYVGVVNAYMYGGTKTNTNSASKFTYTYTVNEFAGYNDFEEFNNSLGGTDKKNSNWKGSSNTYTGSAVNNLGVYVPALNLGVRKFVIEAENAFGYKLRFYFTVTADVNPQIYSMSSTTLTEKSYVGVGLRYQTVNVQQEESNGTTRVVYEPFEYDITQRNTIKITQNSGNYSITNIQLSTTIIDGEGTEQSITKTISDNATSIIIADTGDSNWAASKIAGRPITLSFTAVAPNDAATLAYGTYIAQYGDGNPTSTWTNLKQIHTISSSFENPNKGSNAPDNITEVFLNGIDAYGYKTDLIATDSTTAPQSTLDNIEVQRIDYYLGDIRLGGEEKCIYKEVNKDDIVTTATEGKELLSTLYVYEGGVYHLAGTTYDESKTYYKRCYIDLYTNDEYFFVKDGGVVTQGQNLANSTTDYSKAFRVPVIDGIYYGTNNTLPNVTMKITLIDTMATGGNTATLYQNVTLVREAKTDNMFASNNIVDGSKVEATTTGETDKFAESVYNDTLEVKLEPQSSVTFVVSNSQINTVEGLNNATKITKTNNRAYAVTEYVGISASIDGLEENMKENSQFFIYITEMTENGVTFRYNGRDLTVNDDVYFETEDSSYDKTKTYYTKSVVDDKDVYTEFVPVFVADTTYYELTGTTYTETSDTTYDKTKTYYAVSGEEYVLFNPFVSGTTYYEKSLVRSTEDLAIETYSNQITLNIESINELNSSNYKTETLYFLFTGNGQVYQHYQTFNVYPEAKTASHANTDEQGNYVVEVDDYLKVSNGTTTYYVATLYQWAKGITLNPYIVGGKNVGKSGTLYPDAYKYYFEINTSSTGGAGSAFIDENGMITTGTDFEVKTHTITVNVYMKVSGFNGYFEDSNTKLKLGQFRLYFKQDLNPATSLVSEGVYKLKQSNSSGKIVSYGLLSVQNGYSVYESNSSGISLDKYDEKTIPNKGTFACKVGDTVNLADLIGDTEILSNKTYHMVMVGDDYIVRGNIGSWTFANAGTYKFYVAVTGRDLTGGFAISTYEATMMVYDTSTQENYNKLVQGGNYNLNNSIASDTTWYELDTDHEIKKVESGKVKDLSLGINTKTYLAVKDGSFKIVKINFYVYDETKSVDVAVRPQTNFALSNLVEGTAEFYVVNDDSVTRIYNESLQYGEGSTPTRSYYVVTRNEDGSIKTAKLYTVNYKVVASTVEQESDYISSDALISKKAKELIIKDLKDKNKYTDDYTLTLQEMAENGILTNCDTSETATNYEYTVVNHDDIVTTATEGKELLSTLYEFDKEKGVYIKTTDTEIDSDKTYYKQTAKKINNLITKTYLATVNDGTKTMLYRYQITFYVFEDTKDITYVTSPNTAFDLAELSKEVREAVGAESDATVSFYTLSNNTLSRVTTISLEESQNVSYYVLVGQRYYWINFTLQVSSGVTE
ncbi:MAG: hypothetical protein ACI4R8_04880 [Candidatus Caccovivens sp.]